MHTPLAQALILLAGSVFLITLVRRLSLPASVAYLLVGLVLAVIARHDRDARGGHQPLRLALASHPRDHIGRRSDEEQTGIATGGSELGVLRDSAVKV